MHTHTHTHIPLVRSIGISWFPTNIKSRWHFRAWLQSPPKGLSWKPDADMYSHGAVMKLRHSSVSGEPPVCSSLLPRPGPRVASACRRRRVFINRALRSVYPLRLAWAPGQGFRGKLTSLAGCVLSLTALLQSACALPCSAVWLEWHIAPTRGQTACLFLLLHLTDGLSQSHSQCSTEIQVVYILTHL